MGQRGPSVVSSLGHAIIKGTYFNDLNPFIVINILTESITINSKQLEICTELTWQSNHLQIIHSTEKIKTKQNKK